MSSYKKDLCYRRSPYLPGPQDGQGQLSGVRYVRPYSETVGPKIKYEDPKSGRDSSLCRGWGR